MYSGWEMEVAWQQGIVEKAMVEYGRNILWDGRKHGLTKLGDILLIFQISKI